MGLLLFYPAVVYGQAPEPSETDDIEEHDIEEHSLTPRTEDPLGNLEQESNDAIVVEQEMRGDAKSQVKRKKKTIVVKPDETGPGVYFEPNPNEPASLFAYRLSLPYSVRGASNIAGTGLNIMPSFGPSFGVESGFRFSPDSQFSITYGGDASIWASGRVVGNTVVNVREELIGVTLRALLGPRWGTPNFSVMAYFFAGGLGAFGHSMIGVSALAGFHPVAQLAGHAGFGFRVGFWGIELALDGSAGLRNPLPTQVALEQIGSISIGYRF